MAADYNTAPEGPGSGEAFILGDGLGAIKYLMNSREMDARRAARAAADQARLKAAQEKSYAAVMQGVNTDSGPTYEPLVRENIDKFYSDAKAVMADKSRPVGERLTEIAQKRALLENSNKAGVRADQHLRDTFNKLSSDSRYDRPKLLSTMHQAQYGPDGTLIPAEQYNPRSVEESVDSVSNYNLGEVYRRFSKDVAQKDSEMFERAARPGGTGLKTYFEGSQLIERDPKTHLPILDPATGDPVLRITPATILAARNDPFVSRHLESIRAGREQMEQVVVQKMQANEPLSEQEQSYVSMRAQGRLPTIEQDLAEQLVPYAYSRTRQQETFRPAPRPRAAGGAGTKNVVSSSNDVLPGAVLGAQGANGASGMVSFGTMPALTYGKPGQEAKKYVAKGVKHQEIVTARNDGSPAEVDLSNQAASDLEYGPRHILLRSGKTGNVVFPPAEAMQAAKQGDFGPSEAFAREYRARHPEYKPSWYVEAAPIGKTGTQIGSEDEYLQQLKTEEDAFRQAYARGGKTELDKRLAAVGLTPTGNKPPRFRSEVDLKELAHKKYAGVNATHYVRYSGPDKLLIDSATRFALRSPKTQQAMNNALADADKRTRPTGPAKPKATGIDFGGDAKPAAPTTKPEQQKKYKSAGNNATGISW